jgi:glycosyltransferase involved in cell wall biosynthesis
MRNDGEIIYASGLVPINGAPWLFDTDHVEYLFTQSEFAARNREHPFVRAEVGCKLVQDLSAPNCIGILAWSEAAKRSITELHHRHGASPPRICVAYPGIVPPRMNSNSSMSRVARALIGLEPHTVKLLAIDGQLGVCEIPGRKNMADVLECFWRLRRADYPVELIVVASTEPARIADKNIHFLPRLSRAELWDVYQRSDVFLFLSRQDSFGYVLLEAMYNGVVCVAAEGASLPAVSEIIQPWKTGVLVKFGVSCNYPALSAELDIDSLAMNVGKLILDRQLRDQIAESARKEFEPGGRFNLEERNDRIVSAFFK